MALTNAVAMTDGGSGKIAAITKNTQNKQPVYYSQKDERWATYPYSANDTIKAAGCGPSSASMIVSTLAGITFTPKDATIWAQNNKYTTLNSGTKQAYFNPQFKAFGISSASVTVAEGFKKLREGYYLICLMKGDIWWGGHYTVVWWADDTTVYTNDPYWNDTKHTKPTLNYFLSHAKKCWAIDARAYNKLGLVTYIKDQSYVQTSTDTVNTQALTDYNNKVLQQYNTVLAQNYNQTRGMDLLSSNSLVESPFIIAKIGEYTFGSYSKEGNIDKLGSVARITFPNYMKSLNIVKTNGVLNQYTLEMVYQIVPGKDPNLLDRIFSTVSNSRDITLSYGDWMNPSFIYKEEQAIITKVSSNINFQSSSITYTLECTSKALAASAQTYHFNKSTTKKGSDIIKGLLKDKSYGLTKVFPAMANEQFIADEGLIPGDDKAITVEDKDTDPLTYLNYVVTCMTANTTDDNSVIKDASYHLIINDDLNGLYFKIIKVGTSTRNLVSTNTYEVDIGYPTSTLVTDFRINTDNSWSILYDYNEKINLNNYVYKVGDDGQIYSDYVNSNTGISAYYNRVTEINRAWWTQMTQFPINATLTIKGLLRPAILMTYLRINTYFYGQKHISSGMYIITKQEDRIDANGYRTILSLTRIAGDDDSSYSYTQTTVSSNKEIIKPSVAAKSTGDTTAALINAKNNIKTMMTK